MERKKSDLARAFSEDGALKTHIGGQALIEGIMMRGKTHWSVALREPSGEIYLEQHSLAASPRRWKSWVLVRGCVALFESLILGYKALNIATEHAFADSTPAEISAVDQDGSVEGLQTDDHNQPSSEKGGFGKKETAISLIVGIVIGVALFIALPALITTFIMGTYEKNTLWWNIVDGCLRAALFVVYLWLIGRTTEVKRMFGYHGAEHKTIHCFEHGLALTPHNARSFPRLHVRCGTAFLIMVMIIAIFVYTITPITGLLELWGVTNGAAQLGLVIASRIILMPVIAGISYEVTVRWAGSHPENPLVKLVLWPGMQMQYLTTNEPDDGQIECAIAAMKCVLAQEKDEASPTFSSQHVDQIAKTKRVAACMK